MKTNLVRVAVGVVASTLVGSIAVAQKSEEVAVQASRVMDVKRVGYTYMGVPITGISLSYSVSLAGLDLASSTGAKELERRVNSAAEAACKEIGRKYPDSVPNDAACAKAAANTAMVKVYELVAAAGKESAK